MDNMLLISYACACLGALLITLFQYLINRNVASEYKRLKGCLAEDKKYIQSLEDKILKYAEETKKPQPSTVEARGETNNTQHKGNQEMNECKEISVTITFSSDIGYRKLKDLIVDKIIEPYFRHNIEAVEWSITKAAERMGIDRRTIQRLREKNGWSWLEVQSGRKKNG